jgi:hypothetical protein
VDSFAAGNLVDDYPMDRFVVTNPDDEVPVRSLEADQGRRHLSAEKGGWMTHSTLLRVMVRKIEP